MRVCCLKGVWYKVVFFYLCLSHSLCLCLSPPLFTRKHTQHVDWIQNWNVKNTKYFSVVIMGNKIQLSTSLCAQ